MAFASYYSFPPLSFQLNSLYEGDPFQLNNFEGRGFCRQPARLWFGVCGSGGVLVFWSGALLVFFLSVLKNVSR